MDTPQPNRSHLSRPRATVITRALAVMWLVAGSLLGASPMASAGANASTVETCCTPPLVTADAPAPDASAPDVGGIAARLRTGDGEAVAGDVFLLMAAEGWTETATLYDETPYAHDNGTPADSHESNIVALDVIERATGRDIGLRDFTTAPGGGPSGGITYAIAYLDIVSGGAFTGELRVAATGRIDEHGYVGPINGIDHKVVAAHLAGADVLFTPSSPAGHHLDVYGARHVGERFRTPHSGAPLGEERRLDHYESWGATGPDGMDIVFVRHIADVAAYLCGTGSAHACTVTESYAGMTTAFVSDGREAGGAAADQRPIDAR